MRFKGKLKKNQTNLKFELLKVQWIPPNMGIPLI